MAAACVYSIAEDKLHEISEALELFRKHDGWKGERVIFLLLEAMFYIICQQIRHWHRFQNQLKSQNMKSLRKIGLRRRWLFQQNISKICIILCFLSFLDDHKATTYLAFGHQSSEFQSAYDSFKQASLQSSVEFLIDLYREHGAKKPFCDSIFDLKEQLVALQLVMAQLNKEVRYMYWEYTGKCKYLAYSVTVITL